MITSRGNHLFTVYPFPIEYSSPKIKTDNLECLTCFSKLENRQNLSLEVNHFQKTYELEFGGVNTKQVLAALLLGFILECQINISEDFIQKLADGIRSTDELIDKKLDGEDATDFLIQVYFPNVNRLNKKDPKVVSRLFPLRKFISDSITEKDAALKQKLSKTIVKPVDISQYIKPAQVFKNTTHVSPKPEDRSKRTGSKPPDFRGMRGKSVMNQANPIQPIAPPSQAINQESLDIYGRNEATHGMPTTIDPTPTNPLPRHANLEFKNELLADLDERRKKAGRRVPSYNEINSRTSPNQPLLPAFKESDSMDSSASPVGKTARYDRVTPIQTESTQMLPMLTQSSESELSGVFCLQVKSNLNTPRGNQQTFPTITVQQASAVQNPSRVQDFQEVQQSQQEPDMYMETLESLAQDPARIARSSQAELKQTESINIGKLAKLIDDIYHVKDLQEETENDYSFIAAKVDFNENKWNDVKQLNDAIVKHWIKSGNIDKILAKVYIRVCDNDDRECSIIRETKQMLDERRDDKHTFCKFVEGLLKSIESFNFSERSEQMFTDTIGEFIAQDPSLLQSPVVAQRLTKCLKAGYEQAAIKGDIIISVLKSRSYAGDTGMLDPKLNETLEITLKNLFESPAGHMFFQFCKSVLYYKPKQQPEQKWYLNKFEELIRSRWNIKNKLFEDLISSPSDLDSFIKNELNITCPQGNPLLETIKLVKSQMTTIAHNSKTNNFSIGEFGQWIKPGETNLLNAFHIVMETLNLPYNGDSNLQEKTKKTFIQYNLFKNTRQSVKELKKYLTQFKIEIDRKNIEELDAIEADTPFAEAMSKLESLDLSSISLLDSLLKCSIFFVLFKKRLQEIQSASLDPSEPSKISIAILTNIIGEIKEKIANSVDYTKTTDKDVINLMITEFGNNKQKFVVDMVRIVDNNLSKIEKTWVTYVMKAFRLVSEDLKSTIESISGKLVLDKKITTGTDEELNQLVSKFKDSDSGTSGNLVVELMQSQSVCTKVLDYLERYHYYKCLDDMIDVVRHFKLQPPTHLDDILIEADLVYFNVKFSDIKNVRRAVELYNKCEAKTTYYYFLRELEKNFSKNRQIMSDFGDISPGLKSLIQRLSLIKRQLISCSSEFRTSGSSEHNIVALALKKSSLNFEYSNESQMYSVYCIARTVQDDKDSIGRKITQGELEQAATKIQIASQGENEVKEQNESVHEFGGNTFLEFVNLIRSIQSQLKAARQTGDVFDLKKGIIANGKFDQQSAKCLDVDEFNRVSLKPPLKQSALTLSSVTPMLDPIVDITQRVSSALASLLNECSTGSINMTGEYFRIKTLLSSEQKLFISKCYMDKSKLNQTDNKEKLVSLLRHIVGSNLKIEDGYKSLLNINFEKAESDAGNKQIPTSDYLNLSLFEAIAARTVKIRSKQPEPAQPGLHLINYAPQNALPLETFFKNLMAQGITTRPPSNTFVFGSDQSTQENQNILKNLMDEGILTAINVPNMSSQEVLGARFSLICIQPESTKNKINNSPYSEHRNEDNSIIDTLKRSLGIKIVRSGQAGMGKSTLIHEKAKGSKLIEIYLSGDTRLSTLNARLDRIAKDLWDEGLTKCSLHVKLEMMEDMSYTLPQLDMLLFRLCFIRCLPYREGYLYFDKVEEFQFELVNGYEDVLTSRLSVLELSRSNTTEIPVLKLEQPIFQSLTSSSFSPSVKSDFQLKLNRSLLEGVHGDMQIAIKYWNYLRGIEVTPSKPAETTMREGGAALKVYRSEVSNSTLNQLNDYILVKDIFTGGKFEEQDGSLSQLVCMLRILGDQFRQLEKSSLSEETLKNQFDDYDRSRAYFKPKKYFYSTSPKVTLRDIKTSNSGRIKYSFNEYGFPTILGGEAVPKNEWGNTIPYDQHEKPVKLDAYNRPKHDFFCRPITYIEYPRSDELDWEYLPSSVRASPRKHIEDIVGLIFDTARHIAWGSSTQTRIATSLTKEAIRHTTSKDLDAISETRLAQYQQKIKTISRQAKEPLMIFLREETFKLIYEEVTDIPERIRVTTSVMHGDNGYSYPDMKALYRENKVSELVKELAEGLSLLSKHVKEVQESKSDNKEFEKSFVSNLEKKISNFEGKGFVITPDNFTKIMKITQRAELSLPIIIMGATGCGKTYLVKFLSSCLIDDKFQLVAMHPGLSEEELVEKLEEMVSIANSLIEAAGKDKKPKRLWVLFDEFNTSPLQGLISQIMVERQATFTNRLPDIPSNIVFIAACNPYLAQAQQASVGLVNDRAKGTLMHRVYPLPDRLMNHVWNFEQLTPSAELQYISKMYGGREQEAVKVISACHTYLRQKENENSASLRDVERFIKIRKECKSVFGDQYCLDILLAAFACYFLRLEEPSQRLELSAQINKILWPSSERDHMSELVNEFMENFVKDIVTLKVIPEDIVLNEPLKENLFALFLCIKTDTPLIICGKPGTSKTLSVSIIEKIFNYDGEEKNSTRYFRNLPNFMRINFWGAETTTTASISKVFNRARDIQKQGIKDDRKVVIVFDEIGLAEIAKENPLKILHFLLEPSESSPIGFIGLSNWRLDLSKMNRVLFVSRPDPQESDLQKCFKSVIDSKDDEACAAIEGLVKAYTKYRQEQLKQSTNQPNFHGTRDLYASFKQFSRLLKVLKSVLHKELREHTVNYDEVVGFALTMVIQRNFSGTTSSNQPSAARMMKLNYDFNKKLDTSFYKAPETWNTTKSKILINLLDPEARHLMLFTENNLIEDIAVEFIRNFTLNTLKRSPEKFVYFTGKFSAEDDSDILRKLSPMISEGYTVVLKNLDSIYGSLYDLFNQRYEKKGDLTGCYIVNGEDSQWIKVHENFRCIVMVQTGQEEKLSAEEREKRQQPPFLNRFEKHILTKSDLLPPSWITLLEVLIKEYIDTPRYLSKNILIHNLSKQLLLSLVQSCFDPNNIKNIVLVEGSHAFSELVKNIFFSYKNRGKSSETSDEKQDENVLQVAHKKMEELYSGNMIIESYVGNNYVSVKNFNSEFINTHDVNSLVMLTEKITDPFFFETSCVAVFTLSLNLDIQLPKNWTNLKSSDLITLTNSQIKSLLLSSINSRKETIGFVGLCIQVASKEEAALIPQLKTELVKLTDSNSRVKAIIVIYSSLIVDFEENSFESYTSIDFCSQSWKMVVVDNLKGCHYDKLIELPYKPYLQVLFGLCSQKGDFQKLAFQRFLNLITTYISSKRESELSLKDISQCTAALMKNEAIMEAMLLKVVESLKEDKSKEDSNVLALIQNDKISDNGLSGYRKASNYADMLTYIYALLLDKLDGYMKGLIDKITKEIGFSFVAKTVCLLDQNKQYVINKRWFEPMQSLVINEMKFSELDDLIFDSEEFNKDLSIHGSVKSLENFGNDEYKINGGRTIEPTFEAAYEDIIKNFTAKEIINLTAKNIKLFQDFIYHEHGLKMDDITNSAELDKVELMPDIYQIVSKLGENADLMKRTLPREYTNQISSQDEQIFVGVLVTERYWKDVKDVRLRISSLHLLSNMARIVIERQQTDGSPTKKAASFGLIQSIMLVMLLAEIFEDELCLLQNPEELPKYDLHPDKYSVEGLSTTFRSGSVLNVRHIEDIADIDINNALRSVGAAKEALSAFKVNFIRKKEHKLHLKKPIERLEICFINYVATRKLTPVSDEYHYRDDKDVTRLEELLNMFPDIPDEVLSRTIGMAVSATEDLPTAQHLLGLVLKGSMVAKKNFANALTNLLFDGQNKQTLSTAFTTAPLSLFNNAIIAQLKANNTSDKLREILNMIRSNLYNKLVLSSSMTSTGSGPSLNDILPSGVEFEGLEEVYNDVKLKFIITGKQVAGDVRTLEAMIASKHIVPKSREATITVALKALYKIHGFVRHEPSRGDSKLNEKTAVCLLLIRQVTRVNENMAQFAAMLLKGDDREFRNSVRKWYHVLTAAYLFAMKLITETSGTVQLLKQEYFDVYKRANTSRQTASLDNAESVLSSCSGAVMDSFIKKVNNGETLHPAIYGTTNRLLDLAIDNLNYDIKHPTIPTATLISFFQACLSRLETTNITKNSYNNQLRSELQSVESEFEMEKGTLSSTIKQERARWIKYFEPNLQVTESIINDETDKLSDSIEKAYGPRMQRLYNFLIDKTKVDTTNMVKALESFSSSPVCSALYELLSSENVLKLALELLIKLKKVPVDVMSQAKKREEIIRYLEKHGDLVYLLQKEGELTDLLEENTFSQNSDQISYYFYTLATAASRVVNDIIEKLDKAWSFKPVFQRQKAKLSEFDESIIDSFQKSLDDKKLKETLERNCLWLEGAPFALDENSALDDIQFKVVHELPVFEADPCDKPANMSGKPGAHGRAKQTSDIDTAILDTLKRLKKVQSDETKFTNTQMQRLVSLYNLVVLKKVAVDSSQSQLNLLDHLMQRMPQLLKDYNGKPDARISEALSEYLKDDEALEKCKIIQNANIEDLQLVRVVQLAARYELDNGSSLSPDLQKKVQAYKEEFKMENKNAVKPIVLVIEAALQKQKVSKTAQKLADEHMSIITRIHESARIKSQDSSRFGEPDPALFVKAYALATVVTAKFGIDN